MSRAQEQRSMPRHSQTRQGRRQQLRRQQHVSARRQGQGRVNWSVIAGAAVVVAAIAIFAGAASGLWGGKGNSAAGLSSTEATSTAVAQILGPGITVAGIHCDPTG